MQKSIMFAAAAVFLTTPATAQTYDDERRLEAFSRADLIATLNQLEAETTDRENSRNIQIEFANGMKAEGLLTACGEATDETACLGTLIHATFSAPENALPTAVLDAINTYNARENFGRAFLDENGTISLRTYIIADGGITMENYRRQIELWVVSAADFFGYLYPKD